MAFSSFITNNIICTRTFLVNIDWSIFIDKKIASNLVISIAVVSRLQCEILINCSLYTTKVEIKYCACILCREILFPWSQFELQILNVGLTEMEANYISSFELCENGLTAVEKTQRLGNQCHHWKQKKNVYIWYYLLRGIIKSNVKR